MRFCRTCSSVLIFLSASVSANAQRATEWQVHSIANVGADRFLGGGIGVARRTDGRIRLGVAINAGDLEGSAALRPELLASFHLNPFKRRGVSPYAGGGVAAVFADGTSREYIIAFVGVESRPGRAIGWFAEIGLGGGGRIVAGVQYRVRRTRTR